MSDTKLLFVHGAAGDARIWNPVIAALPGEYEAHAITLTYFGAERWPDGGERFGTGLHGAEVADHAARLGGDVHLVGWSYAVHVCLKALLDRPEVFASALLYEGSLPHYFAEDDDRTIYEKDFQTFFAPMREALDREGAAAAVEYLLSHMGDAVPEARRRIYLDNAPMMKLLLNGGNPPAIIGPGQLATIQTPCCVAMGERTPPRFALPSRALARGLPNARLTVVPGADHFLPETGPVTFAGLVRSWLKAARL